MYEKLPEIRQPEWKFFGLSHGVFKILLAGSFLLLISLIVFWMYRSYYFTNPFVPKNTELQGTALYGRNMEGDLKDFGILFLIENLLVLAVLISFSFSRLYWIRLLILGFLYGGWMFLLLLAAMHSGSLYMIHLVGVFGINVLLGIWLILTLIADHKNRKNFADQWNKQNKQNN